MDSLVGLDVRISTGLQGSGTPGLTAFLLVVSLLHTHPVVLGVALAIAFVFHRRGEPYWVRVTVLAIPCGLALNAMLKEVVRRPRPVYEFPLVTLDTFSFPSGHTAAATLLYGVLGAYLVHHARGRGTRVAIAAGAAALVALVGFSRMYLGAHYLSDVVAAAAFSLLWLAACLWIAHGTHASRPG